ncbi:MutS-related protein [Sunxiuqinia rutila]|uniref:MutS-related protein n=1 Tax=Sunxiuqinia rutila TaxID=1397841 RepID=UPI003D35F1C9
MIFKLKKKKIQELIESFGKIKDDSFNFNLIEKYFKAKDNSDSFQTLSDRTCNDLDFHELFMFLDRTASKVGQQYLFQRLRTIPKSTENVNEKLVELLSNSPELRTSIQLKLGRLTNDDAFFITTLFQDEHMKKPKWFFITKLLSFTSLLSIILIPFNPQMVFVLSGVFVVNLVIHFWNKRNLYQYLDSIPQLLRLIKVARELFFIESLKVLNPNLPKSLDITISIKNRMSFFRMESKMENDISAFFWGFLELFKIAFLLEPLFLFGVLKRLDSKRKEIEDIFRFVGEIDFLISIASLRNGLSTYCQPTIINEYKKLIAQDIYHPLIYDCIENNLKVNKKSILLTGSNMSGKTSFIRTIGVNTITGLTLNTCFAKSFSMPKMRLFSAIRISDDLMNDKSYYFEEVLTIKEMIDKSEDDKPNLFLLDEIFKGTNTIERISAGKAVLSSLTKNENIVFVSTHDIELAELLKYEFDLYHFSEKVDNNTVDFDYKLKTGKLKTRNAIRILQINNYPDLIVNEAIEISKEFDKNTVANKL